MHVMGRMRTISVIVNITLFLSDEALLYHLNKGLLTLCICLTGNPCSLLVGEAYLGSKDLLFRQTYTLFRKSPLPIRIRSWLSYKYAAPTLYKAG